MSQQNPQSQALVIKPPPAWLEAVPAVLDTEELSARTIATTLAATDLDEILKDPDSLSFEDLVGKTIVVHDLVARVPSTKSGGIGWYGIVEITSPDGDRAVASTGSPYILSRVIALKTAGHLPQQVRVIAKVSTVNPGQSSHWIVRPEAF